MTQQPNDDELPIAAELAHDPPATTVPITKDRWYVMRLNGARFGPFSWRDLTGCVNAQMFDGDDLVQGEHNPRRQLRALFPTYYSFAPVQVTEIRPVASPGEQFARNPVKTWLFGPEMRPFETTDPHGKYRTFRLVIVAGLGGVWFLAMLALLIVAAIGGRSEALVEAGAAGAISSFLFALGYFTFTGALLEWDIIFSSRKGKGWRFWFGDRGARWILLGMGSVIMLIGCVAYYSFLAAMLQRI